MNSSIPPHSPASRGTGSVRPGSGRPGGNRIPADQPQAGRNPSESALIPMSVPGPEPAAQPAIQTEKPRHKWFRPDKIGPAFWTITSIFSLLVNVILIVVVISLAQNVFTLKDALNTQLINGLYDNFALMDQAHIRTTIPISTLVPAKFDLPLKQETTVKLTKNTTIQGATVSLNTGGLRILRAPTDIILPAGSVLPVLLDLTVPVDQTIPVDLVVQVDIPLNQTELHAPFTGLQRVVSPYRSMLGELPNNWLDALCGTKSEGLCSFFIP